MTEVRSGRGMQLALVPDVAPLDWFVFVPGFAPAWGDRTSLVEDGGLLVAEVRLEAGWGARVEAQAVAPGATSPLPGVEVLLDGVLAGTTGPDGRLHLTRQAAPGSIELRHPTGQFAGGDYDPDTGAFAGTTGVYTVRFTL